MSPSEPPSVPSAPSSFGSPVPERRSLSRLTTPALVLVLAGAAIAFAAGLGAGERSWLAAAALVAAGALGALAWRSVHRTRAEAGRLTSALREAHATLEQQRETLADLGRQLRTFHESAHAVYWEQDTAGRYTRIAGGEATPAARLHALLGRRRWEGGGSAVDDPQWREHLACLARRAAFTDLRSLQRLGPEGVALVVESGVPRHGADGTFLGYAGIARLAAPQTSATDRIVALELALGAMREAMLVLEASPAGPASLPAAAGWRVAWANAAAHTLLEHPAETLRGEPLHSLLAPLPEPAVARWAAALVEGRPARGALALRSRYGTLRPVEAVLEPVPRSLPARAVLLLDAEAGEAARLRESERGDREARGRDAQRLAELDGIARELDAFAYTVSHDLRAPLRVVEGFARILQEDYAVAIDRVGHEHLARILGASSRMHAMIEALLGLARLSSQPLQADRVDLSALARDIADELRAQTPARQAVFDIDPGLVVTGDRTLLRIALENLLGNAWKYSARREIAHIGLHRVATDAGPALCVSDDGTGFDMRFAERLFGVFQRLHGASEFPGTGIGLASVQRIVRRHGGRVWAESSPDEGSRFYFTLRT